MTVFKLNASTKCNVFKVRRSTFSHYAFTRSNRDRLVQFICIDAAAAAVATIISMKKKNMKMKKKKKNVINKSVIATEVERKKGSI